MATFLNTQSFASAPHMLAGVLSPTYTISDAFSNTFVGSTFNDSSAFIAGNVGIGFNAFGILIGGTYNVAVGNSSLTSLDTGDHNVSVGYQSGANVAGGSSANTFLGWNSGFADGTGPFSNSTALGYNATVTASNQIMIGTGAETTFIPGGLNLALGGGASGYVLTTDGSGNATWNAGGGGGGGDAYLANTQTWTGVNTYSLASIFSDTTAFNFASGATAGYLLNSDSSGNATWINPATPIQDYLNSLSTISIGSGIGTVGSTSVVIGTGIASGNTIAAGSVILGYHAVGSSNAGSQAVAIGYGSSNLGIGASAVSIGSGTGAAGDRSISIGDSAGQSNLAADAIAIGTGAGFENSGVNAICIGRQAGNTLAAANSITLNATGGALNNAAAGFVVAPVRTTAGTTPLAVAYDTTNSEFMVPTGALAVNGLLLTSGATSGYVLTSDGSGNGTWQPASSGPAPATVSTTDATPTPLVTVPVASNTMVTLTGTVAARNTAGTINDGTGGRYTVSALNTGGVLSIVSTSEVVVMASSTGSFNAVVSGTNLIIQVTGIAATNYNWQSSYAISTL